MSVTVYLLSKNSSYFVTYFSNMCIFLILYFIAQKLLNTPNCDRTSHNIYIRKHVGYSSSATRSILFRDKAYRSTKLSTCILFVMFPKYNRLENIDVNNYVVHNIDVWFFYIET